MALFWPLLSGGGGGGAGQQILWASVSSTTTSRADSSFWGMRLPDLRTRRPFIWSRRNSCGGLFGALQFKSVRRLKKFLSFRNLSHLGVTEDIERHVAVYCLGVAANRVFIKTAQQQMSNATVTRRGAPLHTMQTSVGVLSPQPVLWPSAGPARDFLFATLGALFAFSFAGLMNKIRRFDDQQVKEAALERGGAMMPELGVNLGQKESVEWVNMLIGKIWKVYRRSLETWLVELLQPAIDKLGKPAYVKRVEIAELNLDYEPISVRKVRRRASRRANDLQYQFGVRYTGGARCLLNLKLGKAGVVTTVPVGVYNLDVDAELWVKLRLAPVKPFVGTLSIAFVRLPTIKLVLAPFKIVNLFAIPFLSSFLSKLLTVDLPRLLVLPRHITFDFLPQGQDPLATSLIDLLRNEVVADTSRQNEPSEAFVGELTVTVCEARGLPITGLTGWSNPYCTLALGDQVMESKRNKETSHPSSFRDPVWNQDFLFLVEDPKKQKLVVRVRDSPLTLSPNIGYCQVSLADLQDCVPRTHWVSLTRDGAFGPKKVAGKVRLIFTYKSFVEEENNDPASPYIKVFTSEATEKLEEEGIPMSAGLDVDPLAKTLPSAQWDSPDSDSDVDVKFSPAKVVVSNEPAKGEPATISEGRESKTGAFWLVFVTTMAYIIGCCLHIQNPLRPSIKEISFVEPDDGTWRCDTNQVPVQFQVLQRSRVRCLS
ncbi:hypothetical protein R1sor_004737 [Riccia sorocarpa]|uniref:Uncharacterized protein n=1 Tax=Riccia sorocarpa TaxID=122646 RepID=A0ABD3HJR3_9MARC